MGRVAKWFKGLFVTKNSRVRQSHFPGEDSSECSLPSTTELVGLTGEGRAGVIITRDERWAAVNIQKIFRGSLARTALRALKGIVKLQALVRGYLVRKHAAAMLQRIQTLIRVQTDMLSKRINRRLNEEYQLRQSLDTFDDALRNKRLRSPKIVEMDDIYKRRMRLRLKARQVHNMEHVTAMSECEDDFSENWKFVMGPNTPRFKSSAQQHHAANNRYCLMQVPAKSVCGNSFCDYGMSSPGYMEKTQSFKAKLRSRSAPRQRSERKQILLDEVMASRSSVSSMSTVQPHLQQQRYSFSYGPF